MQGETKWMLELARQKRIAEGCKAIDTALGEAVENAFTAGYSADEVHAALSTGNSIAIRALAEPKG